MKRKVAYRIKQLAIGLAVVLDVSGCVTVEDRALVKDILKNPADYYVNVHNADFPLGALRGQLSK